MLWGGRFAHATDDQLFREFNDSLKFDRRLVEQDIQGSIAWANALKRVGVLNQDELSALHGALKSLLRSVHENPDSVPYSGAEDVHSWVESELIQRVGDLGKKLHTGRSRNDQVTTDLRLWVETTCVDLLAQLRAVQHALCNLAATHIDTIFPGYTHWQRAQPIRFAHWCLAYFEMFDRDIKRLECVLEHVDECPLGSGALAGTGYAVDRQLLAKDLGFATATRNSLDAVSDRDFVLELMSAAAISQMHMSRLCEDIIFYCTGEAALMQLGDSVSTGSSLMPQKKNPDAAELIRGKTGRIYASLNALLVTMKGLPLAYNKDMQEDKEALFDGVDQWSLCLRIAAKMIATITINKDNALAAAQGGYSNATELADYLVSKQVPFREAHHIVGEIVRYALEQKKPLEALSLLELQKFQPMIASDVYPALSLEAALEKRNVIGGVARSQVQAQIAAAQRKLQAGDTYDNLVRKATVHDVSAILSLVNHWADIGENLPRSHADIVSHLQDFVVAVKDGKVVGCAALYIYNEEIAEIRSLGVWPQAQGQGLGQEIVRVLNQRAADLGLKKVLVLTRVPRFFEKLGFSRDVKQNLPEKVLKDCQFCPKLNACDETALIYWPQAAISSNAA